MNKLSMILFLGLAGISLESSLVAEKQPNLKSNDVISRVELEVYPSATATKEFLPLAESYESYKKAFADLQKIQSRPSDDFKQLVMTLLVTVKAKMKKIDKPRIVLRYDVDEYQRLSEEIEKLLQSIDEAQK